MQELIAEAAVATLIGIWEVEMMKEKLSVAKHLTDDEYKYFFETHARHTGIMGLSERVNYDLSKVVKVERGNNCLHVHYNNGDWWHYTPDRAWY